jgi:hypothetical protein
MSDISEKIGFSPTDPVGSILLKALFLINQLVSFAELKILSTIEDVKKTNDPKATVTIENNTIVINTTGANKAYADILKNNIDRKIASINNNLSKLNTVINTLQVISIAANVYIRVIDVKEIFLKVNPAPTFPGATLGLVYLLAKQAIFNTSQKEKMQEYLILINFQIAQNKATLNNLTNQARGLSATIKIKDEANKGVFIDVNKAESMIADDKLGTDVSGLSKDFMANNGSEYILKIEKYGDKQLIGRAYYKDTGFIKEQTAPSFVSSADQLYTELQEILNLQ